MKCSLRVVLPAVLILAIATAASAAQFNVTVLPLTNAGISNLGPKVALPTSSGAMATEVGLSLGDRLELVAGLDFYGYRREWLDSSSGRGSISVWNIGARYFLGDDDQLKPFAFGNYATMVPGGDLAPGAPDLALMKLGIGAVAPLNDRWGVVAQTGVTLSFYDDGGDPKETETSTFCAVGLRYNL
jgi:hypothetical protein